MGDLRQSVERTFEKATKVVCNRKKTTVVLSLLVFAAMASGVTKLTIDTSNESFLRADDPTLTAYSTFKDQFG